MSAICRCVLGGWVSLCLCVVTALGVTEPAAAQSVSGGSFGTTTPKNIGGQRNTSNTVTVDGLVGNDLGSPHINPPFGQVTTARSPRIMQGSLRCVF